ncbi:hypothetical protein BpHYR1_013953 [Brachionus plicatilis]|uniref:Uncharacterized protein n=1 Tax=Brachionus plicatilis TaxID=10195 RepID=A0A3M7R3T8_BRAPC|nr:hypothetical protein BpHYR1_013953 [Brachionus plicatilis]
MLIKIKVKFTLYSLSSIRIKSSNRIPLLNGDAPSRSSPPQPPPCLFVRITTGSGSKDLLDD